MRIINLDTITSCVYEMLKEINSKVSCKTLCALKEAANKEKSFLGKVIINEIIKNDELAKECSSPICQDTGIVVCFLELGNKVFIDGNINDAINEGVRRAYTDNFYRKSVVKSPITRINSQDNTPAIIYMKQTIGDTLKIKLMVKGAGSENMSKIKMLKPADGVEGIKKFVLDTVKEALGNPCPPISIGIGIGGDFEKAALLSKEALFLDDASKPEEIITLEKEIYEQVNNLGIGPMGLGGSTTCLFVNILTYPTHIAMLPVAVNIQCHAARHAERII